MSVRKVSELPYVNALNKELYDNLHESLLEISYSVNPQAEQAFQFISKYMKYGEVISSVIHEIVGSEDDPKVWNFFTSAYFHKPVYMYDSLELTGNFYVNKEVDENTLAQYETIMRSSRNVFYALNENVLSAPAINAYSNTFKFYGFDGISSSLEVSNSEINIKTKTNITGDTTITKLAVTGDTTLNNLTCSGIAVFENDIRGCSLCARWADLAEGYVSDAEYEPGTFVKFGGDCEITIADETEVNAVITTKPGFVLGTDKQDGIVQNIALVGRVPVRVVGPVHKFDKLAMSNIPGVAWAVGKDTTLTVIARALMDADAKPDEIHLVEAVVQLQL